MTRPVGGSLWKVAALATSLALILYTGLRAWLVPFTHDESLTYLHAVNRPAAEVFALAFKDANNHPLNTWGMFFSSALFGSSELALRVPNLAAHLLYCAATFALSNRLVSKPAALALFLAFNLNPFVLEYFALARGYGIGLGFMMSSIWLAGEALEERDNVRSIALGALSIVTATLSVLANYSYVFYFIPLCVALVVLRATRYRAEPRSSLLSNGRALLLLCGFAAWNTVMTALSAGREIVDLKRRGALYLGGTRGPWDGSVTSVFEESLSGLPWLFSPLKLGLALLLLPALFLLSKSFLRRPRTPDVHAGLLLASLLFFATSVVLVSAVELSSVKYLEDRSALLYVPLIVGVFGFVAGAASQLPSRAVTALNKGATCLLVLLLVANLATSMNVTLASEWRYDADTRAMLGELEREYSTNGKKEKVRLGVDWWLAPTINFYRVTHELDWLEPVTRQFTGDYYYCDEGSLDRLAGTPTRVMRRYELSGNVLLRSTEEP